MEDFFIMHDNHILLDDSAKLSSMQPLGRLEVLRNASTSSFSAQEAAQTNTLHTPATPEVPAMPETVLNVKEMISVPRRVIPKDHIAPKLTKPGYVCSPSIAKLNEMIEEELSCVSKFTIKVRNVAKISWEEPVDLCGLDLDKLVTIDKKNNLPYVEVYPDDGPTGVMPVNTGINKKAKITFYEVLPKDCSDEEFTEFVKVRTAKMGAKFVSYDPKSGKWVIRVDHF